MVHASKLANTIKHPFRNILERRNRPQLVMAICMPMFQILSGINSILFYGVWMIVCQEREKLREGMRFFNFLQILLHLVFKHVIIHTSSCLSVGEVQDTNIIPFSLGTHVFTIARVVPTREENPDSVQFLKFFLFFKFRSQLHLMGSQDCQRKIRFNLWKLQVPYFYTR